MYRSEVQLTPQIHNGQMAYYWHIFLVDGNDRITVRHGWAHSIGKAHNDVIVATKEMGLGK